MARLKRATTSRSFLAGDAVQLLRDAVLDNLNGVGTGSLRESYEAVVAGGRLVELVFDHDRVLTY